MSRDIQADSLARESRAAQNLIAELASDDEVLNHDMVEGETSLFEAIDAALTEIDECDIIGAGCKEKEKQIAERRQRAERRTERLRGLIEQAMLVAELDTVKRPTATLSVARVPPKPFVDDETLIPTAYWKQPDPVLDKTAINKAVKDGETISGVAMTNGGTSLKIRRA